MKRTLVERVAIEMYNNAINNPWGNTSEWVRESWKREARRIIAMVRRHDSRKGAKK